MYRVVIVEDDPMVSLLNRTFVERDARFQVVQSFQDGRAALAWLEQNPADLAVLDVYMPLFTGLELLHALRGQGVGIDAIMVTAANDAPTHGHPDRTTVQRIARVTRQQHGIHPEGGRRTKNGTNIRSIHHTVDDDDAPGIPTCVFHRAGHGATHGAQYSTRQDIARQRGE